MAILLNNLGARPPKMQDAAAVAHLLAACDILEDGMSDYREEDVCTEWQKPGFSLEHDAWVIVTKGEQLAGYGRVLEREHGRIDMMVRVHPEYRGRGIGTLLLRMAEHRARYLAQAVHTGVQVTLQTAINRENQKAQHLLKLEGYNVVQHFWRILIDMDEAEAASTTKMFKVDVQINGEQVRGVAQSQKRTGLYLLRQYDLYEKVLREGEQQDVADILCLSPVGV